MTAKSDFKELIRSHTELINEQRENLAKRIGNVVATSGNQPLTTVDLTIAMARIDSIMDEFYGAGDEGTFYDLIQREAERARSLTIQQSNDIIEEELKDEPELIPLVKIIV